MHTYNKKKKKYYVLLFICLFVFVLQKYLKKINFFLFFSLCQINFLMFLNCYDILMSKIIFKIKKYYFNIFLNKKIF